MVEAPKALASLELRRRGGRARPALSPLFTSTYVNRRNSVDERIPIAIIESMDYFDDWSPEPCKHAHGWVTAYITPYTTTIECPECGEMREVHDH